jgi:hypothetical protein
MNIFLKIKNSVYNKEYYKKTVLTESSGESIKYIAQVSLILALLASIIFAFTTPKILSLIKETLSTVVDDYPEDLVVSIKEGNATINRPEPYFVTVRGPLEDDDSLQNENILNMMVINTTEPFNSSKFKEYQTLSLLTKNEIVVVGQNSEIKILPLSTFGNVDITKSWVFEKQAWLYKLLPWLMVGMFILFFIGIFFIEFVGSMFFFLIFALVAWLILKIKKINVSHGRAYQVTAHAGTLIMILVIFGLYLKPLNNFFLKLAIFALIVFLNFDKENLLLEKERPISVDSLEKTD